MERKRTGQKNSSKCAWETAGEAAAEPDPEAGEAVGVYPQLSIGVSV